MDVVVATTTTINKGQTRPYKTQNTCEILPNVFKGWGEGGGGELLNVLL